MRDLELGAEKVNRAYVEKLVFDVRRSIEVIVGYTVKPYEAMSESERYAVRYNLIVMMEALAALVLHVVRRVFNEEPETPSHAFRIIRDRGLISTEECDGLLKLLGLRNLLVHRYWVID
ncbi:DUF86 domain-containing protein, partial [Candidatus Bathyarchaeota archaeon]|nr:DUF86 domain-containing protein [Candidatus Bathyarchaeota archaeon]